jgi:hypothetical protein
MAVVTIGTTEGATRAWLVTPEIAVPGDHVVVEIHDFGGMLNRQQTTELYIIRKSQFTDGPACADMPGAIKVADIQWTDSDWLHDGIAEFSLPAVPDGAYWLGEELPGVTPPCSPAGSITVPVSGTPDTAIEREPLPGGGLQLTGVGLLALMSGFMLLRHRIRPLSA